MADAAGFLNGRQCYFARFTESGGQPIFRRARDYQYFLRLIKKYKREDHVRMFAFCLLPGAIYLILQAFSIEAVECFINHLTEAYAAYVSAQADACRTIFRTRISAIKGDAELVGCIKMLEFRPVFADMAVQPAAYPWSSCSYRVLGGDGGLLDSHGFEYSLADDSGHNGP